MKGKVFYFAACALALSACTSEEVLEDVARTQNAIGFETAVNNLTRGDLTADGISSFQVFGFYTVPENPGVAVQVFNDVTVTRQDDSQWVYYDPGKVDYRYWVKGANYYFYAYSCGDVSKLNTTKYGTFTMDMSDGMSASDRVLVINNYICDNTHQHDLVYATNASGIEGKDKGNGNVGFEFKHILSKVQAEFTSNFPPEYKIRISRVSIQNIRNVGSYNPNGGWQNVDRTKNEDGKYNIPFVNLLDTEDNSIQPITTTVGGKAAQTGAAYVLPYAYSGDNTASTYAYIKFNLEVIYVHEVIENGERVNKEDVVVNKTLTGKFNPSWEMGYSYTYNVELNGSAANMEVIAFETKGKIVNDWEEKDLTNAEKIILIDADTQN